jgi:hypothetical protein
MTPSVKKKVEAIIRQAKDQGIKEWPYKLSSRSSLHTIIRTKEQAERFLIQLKYMREASRIK